MSGFYVVVLSNGTRVECDGFGIDANGICSPHGKFMHIPPCGYVYAGPAAAYEPTD